MKLSAHQGFGLGWEPDHKGLAQGSLCAWNSGGGYSLATHVRKWDTVSHGIFPCSAQTFPALGESGSCGHWFTCSVVCGILVPWQGIEPVPPAAEAQSPSQGTTGKSLEACVRYHSRQPYMKMPNKHGKAVTSSSRKWSNWQQCWYDLQFPHRCALHTLLFILFNISYCLGITAKLTWLLNTFCIKS